MLAAAPSSLRGGRRWSRLPVQHEVGVSAEFTADPGMAQRTQSNPKPLSPREPHGGNHVGISGHEYNGVREALQAQGCDIKSDPHVHAFLSEIRNEIGVSDCLPRIPLECSVRSGAYAPALKNDLSTPDGEILRVLQSFKKSRVVPSGLRSRKVHQRTAKWLLLGTVKRIRPVEKHAVDRRVVKRTEQTFREPGDVRNVRETLGFLFEALCDICTIHQERRLSGASHDDTFPPHWW